MLGNEYEWGVHIRAFAQAAQLTPEEIAATVQGGSSASVWADAERVLLAAVEALHAKATLDDADFAALRRHFDADQILELMLLCGFYRTVAYLCLGLDLPLEVGAARFSDFAPPAAA